MTREPSWWARRTFDSGTRQRKQLGLSDPRVFQLTESKVTPPPSRDQEIRQEAYEEAILIARLYEERGANAGAVRIALEARARTPLEEASQPGRASDASSSGATGTDGQPSTSPEGNAPLTSPSEERDLWLIARGFDMALKAMGRPEPQSFKAVDRPTLRIVE